MLNCASVYTYEIENAEIALLEIKSQLEEKITLLENSIGIIMCHPEFITSGVLKHICDNLPFDAAGTTTTSQAVNDEAGELILTMFVMTADDVRFKSTITDDLNDNINDTVKTAYKKISADEHDPPKLAFIFPPFLVEQYSGDTYIEAWKNILPDTLLFGTLAIDDTLTFKDSETIYNGINKKNAMPFVLCYGNIQPRFLLATLCENSALSLRGVITKSKDNIIYEINHINAQEFFTNAMGLSENLLTFPLLIEPPVSDNYDDVPTIRELTFYNEDGAGVLGGNIKEDSTVSLLKFDADSISLPSIPVIEKINDLPDAKGALLFSCVSRRIALMGYNTPLMELQLAKNTIKQDIPFMMGYSGGEICPALNKGGIWSNRYYNYSIVILVV
ncbi:MAG: FIST C-terminal domain-containing protein [Defluviitaleaceae bacterium]|nr:FIST C-terminal domain-containing protein [Defluviitaleaceae bacterium]